MKIIDLFAGCGGMSLGFQNAGFEVCAAFDNWQPAIETYKRNFKHPIYEVDLSNIEDYSFFCDLQPDIIIGGPPCQDYSSAGKRDENLGRANLTLSYAQLISKVKPKYFVMENVERILKSNTLPLAIEIFKKAGYGLTNKVINAGYCGVPQARKRFFLIGELYGADNFLDNLLDMNLSEKQMTLYDYFGNDLGVEYYYRHPRSYNRRGIFSIHEPSPTIRGVNRPIPSTYKKHSGDACIDLNEIRPLTTIERSYIQTFPKKFVFEGSKTILEQMIGNAVPVKLAEYIATILKKYIDDDSIQTNVDINNSKDYKKG